MELINGRTAEEIKRVLEWANFGCGGIECDDCSYRDVCSHENHERVISDAIALIERLEAAVPRWISVEERKPKGFVSVQVYMTDAGDFPSVREGYYVDDDRFYIPALNELHPVSHWKPFDEPPKEGA